MSFLPCSVASGVATDSATEYCGGSSYFNIFCLVQKVQVQFRLFVSIPHLHPPYHSIVMLLSLSSRYQMKSPPLVLK